MKIVSGDVRIVGKDLIVEGKYRFAELAERAEKESVLIRQDALTRGLPEEDLSPGHVVPAVLLPTLRST
jgi:hypothetical protein